MERPNNRSLKDYKFHIFRALNYPHLPQPSTTQYSSFHQFSCPACIYIYLYTKLIWIPISTLRLSQHLHQSIERLGSQATWNFNLWSSLHILRPPPPASLGTGKVFRSDLPSRSGSCWRGRQFSLEPFQPDQPCNNVHRDYVFEQKHFVHPPFRL